MKVWIILILALATGLILVGCTQEALKADVSGKEKETVNVAEKEEVTVAEDIADAAKADLESSRLETDEFAITVYKSPNCGCCTEWEKHLEKAGFKVTSKKTDSITLVRKELGVPEKMQSCHTGIIAGYLVEGHVPADDIKKLLKDRPTEIAGLAAPGMPKNSPGMQSEGKPPKGYEVLSFDSNGSSKIFTSYLESPGNTDQ